MAQAIDHQAEADALSLEARSLDKQAVAVQQRAAEWDEQIDSYNKRSIAKTERDWNLQLADTYRRRATALRRKAGRHNRKARKQRNASDGADSHKGIYLKPGSEGRDANAEFDIDFNRIATRPFDPSLHARSEGYGSDGKGN